MSLPDDESTHDTVELELSPTTGRRRRSRRARSPRSYRWIAAAMAIGAGSAIGFAAGRSTGSDTQADIVGETAGDTSGASAAGTATETETASASDSASGNDSSSPDSSTVEDATASNREPTVPTRPKPATYVGGDGIDSRLAGQPIQIVASTSDGLVALDLDRAGPNQSQPSLRVLADHDDTVEPTATVAAAGRDWIVVRGGWSSLTLLRDGQLPQRLASRNESYVEWPPNAEWGWRFEPGPDGYRVVRIDLDGNVIAGSETKIPDWPQLWLAPGARLVGSLGGTAYEFGPDGQRGLGRGYPIAAGVRTMVVLRCGDGLACELFAVDLDTGDERALGDAALAAGITDYQGPSISPDDHYLAVSKDDVTVVVDLVNGERVASVPGYSADDLTTATAWSNDGHWWFFNDDSDGPSALDTTTGERFPIFDPTLDTQRWTSLAVRSP